MTGVSRVVSVRLATRLSHLHTEFYPPNRTAEKLEYLTGSEVGAEAFIVDALPETTSATLRETIEEAQR